MTPSAYPRWGTGEIETLAVEMADSSGSLTHVFRTREAFAIRVRYRVHERVKKPVFGIGLYRSDGTFMALFTSDFMLNRFEGLHPGVLLERMLTR